MWKRLGPVRGTLVEGDKSAPPTRWWNHPWLAMFVWNTVTTFRVPKSIAEAGYYVGYTPLKGSTRFNNQVSHEEFFSMKVGHEDCKFFALPVDITQPPCSPTIVARSRLH